MKKTIILIIFFTLAANFGVSVAYARSAATSTVEILNAPDYAVLENGIANSNCDQAITPAVSPEGKCENFPTPCDIPDNREKTDKCEPAGNEIKKEKYEKIAENYDRLKNNFQESINDYNDAKKKFSQERLKIKNADKEMIRKNSAEFLSKTVSVMVKYLESLKNKIENIGFVSEEGKNEIIAQLDSEIKRLNEKLNAIESLRTIEEQKNLAGEIRSQWINIRTASKKIIGQTLSAKMNYFILKMEALRDKLKEENTELSSEAAQNIINNFNEKIKLAKSENIFAKEKFAQISNKEQAGSFFKEGMLHMRAAHKYLKEAHKELVSLSREIKKNKKASEDNVSKNPENSQRIETENRIE